MWDANNSKLGDRFYLSWLQDINLDKSNVIVISRVSKEFEKYVTAYIQQKIYIPTVHFFSFHLSLDHTLSLVLSKGVDDPNISNWTSDKKLASFFHDIDDVSSIRKFVAEIRSVLEKEKNHVVVLIMRPAATYEVYQGTRTPLFGRVVKIEEPNMNDLRVEDGVALKCGFLDLFMAFTHDNIVEHDAITNPRSSSFNLLRLFWHFLTNDSKKTGSVRVFNNIRF